MTVVMHLQNSNRGVDSGYKRSGLTGEWEWLESFALSDQISVSLCGCAVFVEDQLSRS
jgi:hypothetical protein